MSNHTPYAAGHPSDTRAGEGNGLAIGGLVCGIVGIPGAVLIALAGVLLGIVGLTLSLVARHGGVTNPRVSTAGLVTSVVALVVGVVNGVLGVLMMTGRL